MQIATSFLLIVVSLFLIFQSFNSMIAHRDLDRCETQHARHIPADILK